VKARPGRTKTAGTMGQNVAKAVVPAAGLGTRMRPTTLVLPKELLPVGPFPLIELALREIEDAGIAEAIVVASRAKPLLLDFLRSAERRSTKLRLVYQPEAAGLADALVRARPHTAGTPFALVLPDNVFFPRRGERSALAQVLSAFRATGKDTCGLVRVSPSRAASYSHAGLVELEKRPAGPTRITLMRPKKKGPLRIRATAYKTFARAVLLPHFFDRLEATCTRAGGDEVPALQSLVRTGDLYGVLLKGRGFDAGNPAGYAAAVSFWSRRAVQPTK